MTDQQLTTEVDIAPYLARLERDSEALARAAAAGPLDARVPGCPAWDIEALLRHIGDVHRWAATVVCERRQERLRQDFTGPDGRDALLAWYREGASALLQVLRDTPQHEQFWYWAPAPNAVAFWSRRQANETSMHRWDAESARGVAEPFDTDTAVDLLEEWLAIITTRVRSPHGGGRSVHLHATDAECEWTATLNERVTVQQGHAKGDCAVRGPAAQLYLLTMNRVDATGLQVHGDLTVLDAWRQDICF